MLFDVLRKEIESPYLVQIHRSEQLPSFKGTEIKRLETGAILLRAISDKHKTEIGPFLIRLGQLALLSLLLLLRQVAEQIRPILYLDHVGLVNPGGGFPLP